ncbi:MAG: hypothetical protein IPP90_15750 [Gemmatimonadaceae bacterium]|nr:hypothetical protein [Gemmatimonadaceae bacterium]
MRFVTVRFAFAAAVLSVTPLHLRAQVATPVAPRVATSAAMSPDEVLATLKKLIDAPAPAGLNDRDRVEYTSHSAWIKSAYDRVLTARERGSGMATGKRQHGVPAADIVRLQTTFESEGRKLQTLSNTSKARHDIAMNAIRNMK